MTTRPWTKNVSPLNGQSAVLRYATSGDTLAGSQSSNAPSLAAMISSSPGVASVKRVRAAGAMQLLLTS